MDGTLTMAMHDFDAIRSALGLPQGQPILEAIAERPKAEAARLHQELDDLEIKLAYKAQMQPGADTLLELLKSRGCSLGILTRNGRQIADITLEAAGIHQFFEPDHIVSRDCCAAKPLPEGVHLLMQRWHCDADNTVMTGDYLYDLKAGFDAGTATVHLDVNGEFPWPEMTTAGVKSLQALIELIS